MLKIRKPDPRVANYQQMASHFLEMEIDSTTLAGQLLEWYKEWCPSALAELEEEASICGGIDHLLEYFWEMEREIKGYIETWAYFLVEKIEDLSSNEDDGPEDLQVKFVIAEFNRLMTTEWMPDETWAYFLVEKIKDLSSNEDDGPEDLQVEFVIAEFNRLMTIEWMPDKEVTLSAWPAGAWSLEEDYVQVEEGKYGLDAYGLDARTPWEWGEVVFTTVLKATHEEQNLEEIFGEYAAIEEDATVAELQAILDELNPLEYHRVMTEASLQARALSGMLPGETAPQTETKPMKELLDYPYATYPAAGMVGSHPYRGMSYIDRVASGLRCR